MPLPRRSLSSFALLLLLSFCTAAFAQIAGRGTIQGSVTDSTGAVIRGAQVVIVQTETNLKHDQKTTGAGFYVFGGLEPGHYIVTITAPGFNTYTQDNISLDALQVFGVNAKLSVGGTESITVSDVPPAINTQNATLGSSMEVDTYKALPLVLGGQPRDPTAFIYFTPGVTGGGGVNQMNGGQGNLNETYIDGVAMNDVAQQGDWAVVHSTFSVDAVEQFQVETSGVSAAYQGQGLQNYTHKSGSNTFHGSAFEYFRNTALDSWGFYAPSNIPSGRTAATKPVEHQNEFGATFGGHVPYLRDKIFFFVSYDNTRYTHTNIGGAINIPTLAERQGDFSDFLTLPTPQKIYDPTTTNCNPLPCTRQQFMYQGRPNVIDPARLSAISLYQQKFLPAPTNNQVTANWLGGFVTGFNYPRQSYKVDVDLFKNHDISLLFLEGGRTPNPSCCNGSGLPPPYVVTVGNVQNNLTALASDTWTINSRTVNKLSYAFNSGGFNGVGNSNPGAADPQWWATAAGITNLPAGQASNSFPSTAFSGTNAPLGWTTNDRASHGSTDVFHIQDGFQTLFGRHSLSIGAEYQWEDANSISIDTGTYLNLTYSNNETASIVNGSIVPSQGAAYASFLIGAVDNATVTDNRPVQEINARYHNFSPYVQDDFKATPRLTINAGLRWDVFSPWAEKQGRFSYFDPTLTNAVTGTPGSLRYGGNGDPSIYCNCARPVPSTWLRNVGPRLGFAYALADKTVMRGSYGLYYSHAGGTGGRVNATVGTGQLGFGGGGTFASSNSGITPGLYLNSTNTAIPNYTLPPNIDPNNGTGFTTNAAYSSLSPLGTNYVDPYLSRRSPYYQNFNFGFTHEFPAQIVATLDYSGSTGHFLGTGIGHGGSANQIDPRYYVLGSLLTSAASPANVVKAQAILPGYKLPFANFSPNATIGQSLRPYPQYGNIGDIWADFGNSNYHSLQMQLKQRAHRGFTYQVSYTWSKSLDDTGGSRTAYGVNGVSPRRLEYGLSGTDIPHHVAIFAIYESPFGKGTGGNFAQHVGRQFVKGWSVSAIGNYLSGTPITVTASSCTAPFSGACYPDVNPNYIGNGRINGPYGRLSTATNSLAVSYLDPNAFKLAAPYTFGNAPHTAPFGLRNPSGHEVDMSVRRSFALYEKLKFTLEGSIYNIDNHVDFRGPNAIFGPNTFGTVNSQANTTRDGQLSARFDF